MSSDTRILKERLQAAWGENRQLEAVPGGAPSARCENGVYIGKMEGDVSVYRGIPFAAPPTGPRRWKAPVPAEPREGIFEAYYNGKTPIQTEWPTEAASYYPQGEDCLYLNIWVSTRDPAPGKTVMVFFHGGSYGWGGTADPIYNGYHLAARNPDIVLVTVGYRTGFMGFVDLSSIPGGEEFPDAPNLGILDQIEALRWVQKNIAAFGGDPGRVTIFGESAGGGSVSLLPIIPQARGLFRRVIAESGSVALTFSKEECQYFTDLLKKESRCSSMADLMALDEEGLKALNEKLNTYNNFPQRDGKLIPLDPFEPYRQGKTADIDMMIGTNRDEANYWIGEVGGMVPFGLSLPIKFENDLRKMDGENKARVRQYIKDREKAGKRRIWRMADFYTETMFRLPALRQAECHARRGGRAYVYYWAEPSSIRFLGACHAVELSYVFGNLEETIYTGTEGDPLLAKTAQELWVSFARTGVPVSGSLTWPPYEEEHRRSMVLGKNPAVEEKVLEEERELLEPLVDCWISTSYANLEYNVPFARMLGGIVIGVVAFIVVLILLLT